MMKNKRAASLLLAILVLFSSAFTFYKPVSAISPNEDGEAEMKNNDYILYFVNAGDRTPETVEGNDKMGLYASKTEQVYGPDSKTGKKWGLVTATSNTSVRDAGNKFGSLRYYNGPQTRDKALHYKFDLPDGEYDLTLGFKNPWSGRSVNIISEGKNISNGDYDIGSYDMEKEVTYQQISVTDGELDLKIQGPATAGLSNYNDPLVNYIIIRKYVVIPLDDLKSKISEAMAEADKRDTYTKYSLAPLNKAIEQAKGLIQKIEEDQLDVGTKAVQEDIRASMKQLETALGGLALDIPNVSFKPGQEWRDTNGAVIQAHGGGIMFDEKTETYYWYGEDKTNGYLPATGVHAYSSKDLYNWKDEGVVMKAIEKREDMETDPYFIELYKNRSAEEKDVIFSDINTARGILERPKVIYNEKTGKYVLWLHVDGPYNGSDANYAKAKSGVAVSDSPTGPFEYLESNRLNKMPEGEQVWGPNTGMARDMTLFKDEDGTAYIIYSSEENYSLYISKLNEDYTAIAGDQYGKDFIRAIPGQHREAPAMFKYDGKYYMITSGATGWDPNPARYSVADSVMGKWKTMGDPSVGTGSETTFRSQSTYVIPVDAKKGKFIYMGDRWNKDDLTNSRYVWLPIEFGQEDEIILKWYDEWKLDLLDRMGRVTVNTELPKKVAVDEIPELPNVVNVTNTEGKKMDTPVKWKVNSEDFAKPGSAVVEGTLPELANKVIRTEIIVIPDHVRYFVHAGGAETRDYKTWSSYMQKTLLNKEIVDQQYEPEKGQTWGYVGDRTRPAGTADEDLFSSLRYLLANSGNDLSYKFILKDGKYTVYTGLHDRWYTSTKGSRKADIVINGEPKTKGYVFTNAYDVLGYKNIEIKDGKLDVTVRRVAGSPDPQISWIMIVEEDTTAPVVTFHGNKGAYSVDEQISISCSATDDLSGIAEIDCPKIEGRAYEFQIGVNKLKAAATDRAGHTTVEEVEFTVTVDYKSLSTLTQSLVSNASVAESLSVKLQGAEDSASKGNKEAMEGKLNAYINQLRAQSGKTVTEENAALLISLTDKL
ncbi:family 43 glycosylhydrolase [Mesobacillus foraminis]|uniref:family 43 glycosylhydrolase n=1 Tax=Mesobacillus foraminis TaxID=279826 RepID=UPI0039A16E1D